MLEVNEFSEDEGKALEQVSKADFMGCSNELEELMLVWQPSEAGTDPIPQASNGFTDHTTAQPKLSEFVADGLKVVTSMLKPVSLGVERLVLGVEALERPDLLDIWRVYHLELEEMTKAKYQVEWNSFEDKGLAHWIGLDVDLYSPIRNSFRLLFELPYQLFVLDELSRAGELEVQFLPQPIESAFLIQFNETELQSLLQAYQDQL